MLKESKIIEFKKEMSDTFLKTVCAFANYGTGTIMFGVTDEGEIVGIDDMKKYRLDIENKINDSIDPIPEYYFEEDDKNKVLKLIVKEGTDKPYFYKSKTYMRRDTSTIEVDKASLKKMIMDADNISYDSLKTHLIEPKFTILENKLRERIKIDSFDIDTLKTLELYSDADGYNIAAELLADTNKNYGIDIARFGENINIILDRMTIDHVSIIEQYYKALEMFRHYYVYEEIKGAERVKKERIPENAYREAIANALVHRAWDDNANINVSFYDDRIEILSPGGLPKGMTEKEYLEDKLSKARNPIIANIFFRLNLIERMGTGVQRINAEYKNSVNKPQYKVSDNLIIVTLPLISTTTQTTQENNILTDKKTDINRSSDKKTDINRSNEKMTDIERKAKVVEIAKKQGFINNAIVREAIDLGEATIKRLLNEMVEEGTLRAEGENKGRKYYLVDKGN